MSELTKEAAREMAEYVDLTTSIINDQKRENASLRSQLTQQKQASALDSAAVSDTVDKMIKANFIKQAERADAIRSITNDPAVALTVLNKLASKSTEERSLPSLGKAANSATSSRTPGNPNQASDDFFEQKFRSIASRI